MVAEQSITEQVKRCPRCQETKPLSAFSKHSAMRDGLRSLCRICHNAATQEYRKYGPKPRVAAPEYKYCPKCRKEKRIEDFGVRPGGQPRGYCRVCERESQHGRKQPGRRRIHTDKDRARATRQRRERQERRSQEVLQLQGGVCAICGQKETTRNQHGVLSLALDHDHRTGTFRGFLCFNCNIGLGKFKDSPELLARAITYLTTQERVVRSDSAIASAD